MLGRLIFCPGVCTFTPRYGRRRRTGLAPRPTLSRQSARSPVTTKDHMSRSPGTAGWSPLSHQSATSLRNAGDHESRCTDSAGWMQISDQAARQRQRCQSILVRAESCRSVPPAQVPGVVPHCPPAGDACASDQRPRRTRHGNSRPARQRARVWYHPPPALR